MNQHPRKRKKLNAPKGSTREKGDLVEQVIASIHDEPGVVVERNVFLSADDGTSRTREIDVLLTSTVAGYRVRIAIECKNESKKTAIKQIDEFVGKLQDVGIPVQHGIFVSASGYASGAVRRANRAGIQPLLLKDLASELPPSIRKAVQSIVNVLLAVTHFSVRNSIPTPPEPAEIFYFYDESGTRVGAIPDLIWQDWLDGIIPDRLGEYVHEVRIPSGWAQIVGGARATVYSITATVRVSGHVVTIDGTVQHVKLVNANTKADEKEHVKAEFTAPTTAQPVLNFLNEEELAEYLKRAQGVFNAVGRFRMPRIVWQAIYWPPSDSALQKLQTAGRSFLPGSAGARRLSEIEGSDMFTAWDPISSEHPYLRWLESQ